MTFRLQDQPPFAGHAPQQERALGGYAALMTVYLTLTGAFAGWFRGSGRRLPDRTPARDLALMAVATHKVSRLIAKDRVASAVRAPFTEYEGDGGPGEVNEKARGSGLRRAIGELLVCPYCLGLWIATAFSAGLLVAPRLTRLVISVLSVVFASDLLQMAYKKAEDATT
jgi:hypothetical protein